MLSHTIQITNTKNEDNQSNDDPKTEKLFKFPKRSKSISMLNI